MLAIRRARVVISVSSMFVYTKLENGKSIYYVSWQSLPYDDSRNWMIFPKRETIPDSSKLKKEELIMIRNKYNVNSSTYSVAVITLLLDS